MKVNDFDAERVSAEYLDDVLRSWHRWASADRDGAGYPAECPSFRLYRPTRLYDGDNGASDAQADATQSEAVNALVQSMTREYRIALSINARNLVTGVSVWSSPQLPQDVMARARVVAQAREVLTVLLRQAGLWWA